MVFGCLDRRPWPIPSLQPPSYQAELHEVEDGLAALQGQYDDALAKKAELEASAENTNKKIERATTVRGIVARKQTLGVQWRCFCMFVVGH